ncbi:nicotinate-nucleotide--dimethylbenzimidazole phosphoribosyltransferase [Anopheles sinensis]|uniref:Nicotinate-nucleotide--dimethylbenzimidazole phosphoribosyltransferase n=1 Tax=Anopheles sinensis TaxID=74873 RepID=A0A084VTH0_ANOSI|nr:nicotinate-nucleotide--dimethylbenzimidazole phosphoribosyltransferase [Anopheles sinensis]
MDDEQQAMTVGRQRTYTGSGYRNQLTMPPRGQLLRGRVIAIGIALWQRNENPT